MTDQILFHSDKLTVSRSHVTAGFASIFYPNISVIHIYEGKPFKMAAISALVSAITLLLVDFVGPRLLDGLLPSRAFLAFYASMSAIALFGLLFKQGTLYLTVDGQPIAVLKSTDFSKLGRAKVAIETAKQSALAPELQGCDISCDETVVTGRAANTTVRAKTRGARPPNFYRGFNGGRT